MSSSSSNVTSGFIDLATYDELEKYMYGGMDATAYFVRETRKSTWFTQVPVVLSRASGTPGFGTDWSVQISRAGDYLLNSWLRVTLPAVVNNNFVPFPTSTSTLTTGTSGVLNITTSGNYFSVGQEIIITSLATGTGVTIYSVSTPQTYLIKTVTGAPNTAITIVDSVFLQPVSFSTNSVAVTISTLTSSKRFFWTKNLMHNLIKEASITFNDLVAARFDNYFLDFWTAFTVPASKRDGYDTMIGNLSTLNLPNINLPQTTLNLPLPFFFARDSGVALPTAAIPYNDMRINFTFRDWNELLNTISYSSVIIAAPSFSITSTVAVSQTSEIVSGAPVLGATQVWANYAIVSNDERKKMACAPRDILIEQVQTAPRFSGYGSSNNTSPSYDIRFSQAVKALFFAVRNTSNAVGTGKSNVMSNYTLGSYGVQTTSTTSTLNTLNGNGNNTDPIAITSLVYENTTRLSKMGSDFYSLVDPWYHAPTIPSPTTLPGYHMYSYSLDFYNLDPMGSTNYGKLTNVSIQPTLPDSYNPAVSNPNLELIVTAVNNNIVRISGGALGFPVL